MRRCYLQIGVAGGAHVTEGLRKRTGMCAHRPTFWLPDRPCVHLDVLLIQMSRESRSPLPHNL